MTGDKSNFNKLTENRGGSVVFGDNIKSRIMGKGIVGNFIDPTFNNVLFVPELKHNLLSISQLCGKTNRVVFEAHCCRVERISDNKILLTGQRNGNIYSINLKDQNAFNEKCFNAVDLSTELIWHRKLGHISLTQILKLAALGLVSGLPKIKSKHDFFCTACVQGKQTKTSFKSVYFISTNKPLELIHLDLFGPSNVQSLGGKSYAFVLVDDFSRFTWVYFLGKKDETFDCFKKFVLQETISSNLPVRTIRSDNGGEFTSSIFSQFCADQGIRHTFSAPRTPQQNGVVEQKNRALLDLSRTMLLDHDTPKKFWAEAVSTACYILNRTIIRKTLNKTSYELFKGRTPNISYFHPFVCKCFVLSTKDYRGKFDAKSNEAIFLG
ncbi:Retrovirus-related Pol polyprotein from transposon TNT 1-94 [Linum perenne]